MSAEIAWHVDLAVKPRMLGDFTALTAEMVAATRAEPGVLSYQRFVSEDGARVDVYERYVDSGAALAHLEAFVARFGQRYAALVERRSFTVFGEPSVELRAFLDRFGAVYLKPLGGLAYW
jgi:quinol monooxygenase YgiN